MLEKHQCVCGLHAGAALVICDACSGIKPASPRNPFSTGMPVGMYKRAALSLVPMLKALPWWKRLFNSYDMKITDKENGGFTVTLE